MLGVYFRVSLDFLLIFIIVYVFYYEQQVKRELKRIHISGYRGNERLKAKTDYRDRYSVVYLQLGIKKGENRGVKMSR